VEGAEPLKFEELFNPSKRGSQIFRKILDYTKTNDIYYSRLNQVKSFLKCTDTQFTGKARWESNLMAWNIFGYPNRFKVFLLKYYSNVLGTGNRVLHIDPTKDPACIFCAKAKILPPPLETFSHVFFDCVIVNSIIKRFCEKYLAPEVNRQNYFTGQFFNEEKDNRILTLILDCLRYCIWETRLQKRILSYSTVELEVNELIGTITGARPKLNAFILNCEHIYADGDGAARRGRQEDDQGP
jgi:hypothetical protein